MNADNVVVDANIAFKALISHRGDLRARLDASTSVKFFGPGYLFVELFKHKTRLANATRLSEGELVDALQALVARIEFVNEATISLDVWMEAFRLCKSVDDADTPYVALTIHLDGRLWTEDVQLKDRIRAKGFDRFFPV